MHTNLKTVSGCATRLTVTVTAPEGADKTLTAYCRSCGDSHQATVEGDTVIFPPLPAGEHLYELRAGGIPVIHGHLISRQSAFPMPSGSTIDHAISATIDGTTVANITVTMTAGPRGPKGDPGLTDTEHALLTAAANGALWVPGSTGSVTLAGQQGDGVAISAANNTSRVQVQDSGVTITAKRAPQWLEAGDTPAFHDIRTAKDLTATDESIAAALSAKQDTLTPGDGINISGNVISATSSAPQLTPGDGIAISAGTVAMSGSLDKSLAIGSIREEEGVICDGPCAVWHIYYARNKWVGEWLLVEDRDGGNAHYTWAYPEWEAIKTKVIRRFSDLEEYAAGINACGAFTPYMRAVAVCVDDTMADLVLIPKPGAEGFMFYGDMSADTPWDMYAPEYRDTYGCMPFTNQRVTGMVATPTDYTLSLNGTAILPPTNKVEDGNTAPVTSAALYEALGNKANLETANLISSGGTGLVTAGRLYTALGNRSSMPTLQTTISNSTSQIATGAAVYKALGNRTSLQFDTTPTANSTKLMTSGSIYTALQSAGGGSGSSGGGLATDSSGDTIIDTGSGLKLFLSTHGALEGEMCALQIAPYKQESWGSAAGNYLAVGAEGAYITMDDFNGYEIVLHVGNVSLYLNEEKLRKLAALLD